MSADYYPDLAVDPNEEELTRDWALSPADLVEVQRSSRGAGHRHRFAVQLCALRTLGRFIDEFADVPVRIANHVGRQLGLPPSLYIEEANRPATATEQAQRIREYLGYRPFDDDAQERLRRWLTDRAIEGTAPEELSALAITTLRAWMVEIPARSTVDRLVGACSSSGEDAMWQRIRDRLTPEFCIAIDELLVAKEDGRSMLFQLKQYPPEPTPATINTYLDRFDLLRSLDLGQVDLAGLSAQMVKHMIDLVERYDVKELRRFAPAKRYVLIACFLIEAQKTTLDHLVEMNRVFLTGMSRRARHALEHRHKEIRQRAKKGLDTVLQAMDIILDRSRPAATLIDALYLEVDEASLRDAVATCRDLRNLGDHGYFDELRTRHSHLKRYLVRFLALPFKGQPGTEGLLSAIATAAKLNSGEVERLPADTPVQFASAAWRGALADGEGQLDRRLWEIALAFAVRDALRSGDLYLAESRHHVSFWNLIYNADQWKEKRTSAYDDLKLSSAADTALDPLRAEFDKAARAFVDGLETNPFAKLRDNALELSRRDAIAEPDAVRELRRVVETHLPRIRIEDLLIEVDSWCGFTQALVPPSGYEARTEKVYPALLASLVAHGTNLGIATMAQSTKGITVDALHRASRWFLRTEALRAANGVLVDYHHRLPLASAWGDGVASSSDGQRFGIQSSSLLGSFVPRCFGHYDRAITVYTHVADQFSVFSSRAISCSVREAIYVLDGLLENNTILRPREHYTDTHGFTEQLFGLCYLLGYSFMPRLKDLKDQQLYRLDRSANYGDVDALFRATVDVALIREQWDQLVRVASSLRNRTAPAHVVLERLAASSPTDRLAKALTMLGRVVKTVHILRYLHDSEIRDRVHLQLNRGESRHALARRLFFANQGAFRSGDYEEIMNKVTALSVLSNAVLVWNTVRINEIVRSLEKSYGQPVLPEHLARLSPVAHGHVIPSGTYHFERASADRPVIERGPTEDRRALA